MRDACAIEEEWQRFIQAYWLRNTTLARDITDVASWLRGGRPAWDILLEAQACPARDGQPAARLFVLAPADPDQMAWVQREAERALRALGYVIDPEAREDGYSHVLEDTEASHHARLQGFARVAASILRAEAGAAPPDAA